MSGMADPGEFSDEGAPDARNGFDSILSNPPFQNQLRSRTSFDRGLAALQKVNAAGRTSAYTDAAAVFLDLALGLVREGGTVAMLLPQSVLASRDVEAIRAEMLRSARLEHLWISGEHAFDGALVATCAPVMRMGKPTDGDVSRSHTLGFTVLADIRVDAESKDNLGTLAHLTSAARGIPKFGFEACGTLADIAMATADFRDEYYGLEGLIVEAETGSLRDRNLMPVVTSGMIDPAVCHWGVKPTRLHKKRWLAPCIDPEKLAEGRIARWLEKRLVPKLMLATQTRTLEVFVDVAGRYVPCMPVITVTARDESRLWHAAAALASPVATAVAFERYAGTAMTSDAIKLAARQVLTLPVPVDVAAWDRGAEMFRTAQGAECDEERVGALVESGRLMCGAYRVGGVESERLMGWWIERVEARQTRRKRG